MSLNRLHEPELRSPESILIPQPEEVKLDNGLSLYVVNTGEKEVLRFELIFPSGISGSGDYLDIMSTHQLADSGTELKSASQLAEAFDFYGAYFQQNSDPDFKIFSLFTLTHHLKNTLPILDEILKSAVFPEEEIEIFRKRNIQQLAVNRDKVSWLSRKEFNGIVFGNESRYGFSPDENDYSLVTRDKLLKIFHNGYNLADALMVVAGKIDEDTIDVVNKTFGQISSDKVSGIPKPVFNESGKNKKYIEKKGAVQSGIRIGKLLCKKSDPDFIPMQIVNTILGGYFGSRLMSNIREDKGYTYGIGSGLHSYLHKGVFFISTEVGKQVCDAAVSEIYTELEKLATLPVPDDELNLVKRYLTGAFQRGLDGPFAIADRFKSVKLHDLNYDYFNNYLDYLKILTPGMILDLAARYLRPESMTEVIAG